MENKNTNSKVGKRVLPWTAKSVSRVRQDIRSWNNALNISRLADDPSNWRLQLLYDEVMLDALVTSQRANRDNQVHSSEFSLKKPNGEIDKEQTKLLKKHPLYRFFNQTVLDTEWFGYNVVEFSIKEYIGTKKLNAEVVPRYNFTPQNGRFFKDYTDPTQYIKYRELPEYGTWILEFYSGHEGLLNKLVAPVLLTRFTESCWSELAEIYGIPPRVMKTNTQDTTQLNRAERMMRDMGSASWFIIDETEEFEFAKGVSTNGDVYKNLLNHLRDKICQMIVGGLIGQDTENGSRSKDQVSFDMLWLLVQSDMARIEEAWNNTIIPALVAHGVLKGELTFEFEPAEDLGDLWKFVQGLLPHYQIDPEWIKEKFGIEITAERTRTSFEETLGLMMSHRGEQGFFHKALLSQDRRAECGCLHTIGLKLPKEAPKTETLIQQIAEAEGSLRFSPETMQSTAKTLIKGFNRGLSGSKIKLSAIVAKRLDFGQVEIRYGIDDPHLLTSFELNMFRFSAGKTLAEVQALNQAFRDAPNFDVFRTNAQRIGDVFNETWLRTEYDTAVLTGEGATTYYSLMQDAEVFPYWEYRTVGDGSVRPEHADLDGLILPANDPMWQKIYPPNGWNCRCYVVARSREEVQGINFSEQRDRVNDYFGSDEFDRAVSQGFGVNRAVTGEVFTANQQYITGKNLSQTNRQLNSLTADDYRMKPYSEAKKTAKADAPTYEGSAQEWLANRATLNNVPTIYDYNGRALAINPTVFEIHTTGKKAKRSLLLEAVTDTIDSADEVWLRGKTATSKMDEMVYLKYYLDRTIVVIGRQNKSNIVELLTWFPLNEKQEVIDRYRRGLLIKK
ncbi:phage portal protein family protein [Cecembia rubra]|uniref:SPP1 gp7 family putative phage head morphogenesis protein n=1 Tax=Cecembia rubra TaxID=1485585 RepID=A0A2P8EAS7_9BACT|nr:DUF935 family protein [Cecembia rubra]PSL06550.1 SPP1 gp7 family putative phage head morphogenesis protein [Cecembia rubra]